jgi:hypothetical protein
VAKPAPVILLVVLASALSCGDAGAHQVSESYVMVDVRADGVTVQCEVAVRDLQYVLDPQRPAPGSTAPLSTAALPPVLPGRPLPTDATIAPYVATRLRLTADGEPMSLEYEGSSTEDRRGIPYRVLSLRAPAARPPRTVAVEYGLFFEDDPKHHAIVYVTAEGREQTAILGLDSRTHRFTLGDDGSGPLATFAAEGVRHIWAGHDHLLFLLVLLLPAVLRRDGPRLEAAPDLRAALIGVAKVVTAFTVAHSITLSLAALRVVRPPTTIVEVSIAVSVLFAAVNNLRPWFGGREWALAFGFGLIHGFGFAGVLAEIGLPAGSLLAALAGFNLGVEAGQLAIVAVFVPLAFAVRGTWAYRTLGLRLGSMAAAGIAAFWIVERAT